MRVKIATPKGTAQAGKLPHHRAHTVTSHPKGDMVSERITERLHRGCFSSTHHFNDGIVGVAGPHRDAVDVELRRQLGSRRKVALDRLSERAHRTK